MEPMEIIKDVVLRVLPQLCQLSAAGLQRIFHKPPGELTDSELEDLTDQSHDAAWAMYVEMVTRISTQPLPDEDGDEQTALDSVYSLFATTRNILKEYGRESPEFSKLAVLILNQKVRPFTAKWHVPSLQGAFDDAEKCAEFRAELRDLQGILRGYMQALAALAGVEDFTDISEE